MYSPTRSGSSNGAAEVCAAEAAAGPADGDVVVSPDHSGNGHYSLGQAPGDPQVLYRTRDEALRLARRFARGAAVDVWLVDGPLLDRIYSHRGSSRSGSSRR